MRAIRLVLVLGLALLGASCGGSDDEGGSGAADAGRDEKRTLSITATDFGFATPDSIPAGTYETEVTNEGRQPHQALIYRLDDGVSYGEFVDAVMEDDANLPQLASSAGGHPKLVGRGETHAYGNDDLELGDYAVVCFIRDPKTSEQHVALGMVAPLVVE